MVYEDSKTPLFLRIFAKLAGCYLVLILLLKIFANFCEHYDTIGYKSCDFTKGLRCRKLSTTRGLAPCCLADGLNIKYYYLIRFSEVVFCLIKLLGLGLIGRVILVARF